MEGTTPSLVTLAFLKRQCMKIQILFCLWPCLLHFGLYPQAVGSREPPGKERGG